MGERLGVGHHAGGGGVNDKGFRLGWFGASLLALLVGGVAAGGACASGGGDTQTHASKSAGAGGGTGGGKSTGAGKGGGGGNGGAGQLDLCVLNEGDPQDPCVNPPELEFGTVSAGTQRMRLFRIDNNTGGTTMFETVKIGDAAFQAVPVRYDPDPQDPTQLVRVEMTLPAKRKTGESLYFEVTFTAGQTAGPLPAKNVKVGASTSGVNLPETVVPMNGEVVECPPGMGACTGSDGCETNLETDVDHCGTCDNPCFADNGTPACVDGQCAIGSCETGFADCDTDPSNGCEANLLNGVTTCGSCTNNCNKEHTDAFCNGGNCNIIGCNDGYADCDLDVTNGCETDVNVDMAHCGGCNLACDFANASEQCVGGDCVFNTCEQGFADCDNDPSNGCEVELATDLDHCGTCNNACDLDHATATCTNGTCQIETCDTNYGDCDQDDANGCEINILTNINHCGDCPTACDFANANQVCLGGTCVLSTCAQGFADCDANQQNGCETNILTSSANCGGCDNPCNVTNASSSCQNGTCTMIACNQGFADCDNDTSNGCEVNLKTSLDHCGACGSTCDFTNAGETCNNGVCVMGACDTGFANCDGNPQNGCETNTQTSMSSCGGCGQTCDFQNASESCLAGVCVLNACNTGFANCDNNAQNGCEVNTNTSLANCGACGQACSFPNASAACQGGTCALVACNLGFADCDGDASNGCEVNLKTSLAHCGACNAACDLPNAAETCNNGVCTLGACSAGFANCDGNAQNGCEVNTDTSLGNCGGCGVTCDVPHASESCLGGTCVMGACDPGFANCDGGALNGCEVNVQTNLAHCGGCNLACNLPNASESCVNGTCTLGSCNAGFDDCDGDPSNGCEVNLKTDLAHCGGCGAACDYPNAAESCSNGICTLGACNTGFANCDGNAQNGCEANTNTSLAHCGDCNQACDLANAAESCVGGTCTLGSCNAGFANCDGNPNNGCEANTDSSLSHCGGCNQSCNLANGSESCVSGTCTLNGCDPGFANCDSNPANGCEINTNTNLSHCGACGALCALPNALTSCSGGSCLLTGCGPGFGNCDGNPANGCEVNTNTSLAHCGGCGSTCNLANASESCIGGTCVLGTCDGGFANCDNNPTNGCEVNTNTSLSHCGGCGIVCNLAHASESCVSGACTLGTCDSGWRNCNGVTSDGCEINSQTDVNNCGNCGVSCAAQFPHSNTSCSSGACSFVSCQAGFYNIDGNTANGCEYACTFQSATDLPDDGFVDANCDGIDGDVAQGIFVATSGNDSNPGTRAAPMRTINGGLNQAQLTGKTQVFVSNGTYVERVTLRAGISLYGGYSATSNWTRSAAFVATISGTVSGGYAAAIVGTNIVAPTTIDRFTVETLSPSGTYTSNYAVYCTGCSGVTLKNSTVEAGSGTAGGIGGNGAAGSAGTAGSPGGGGSCDGGGSGGPGGVGGTSTCGRTGGTGGKGGADGDNNGSPGTTGVGGTAAGNGGGGGCTGGTGGAGTNGAAGAAGANGAAGAGGSLVGGFWVAASGTAGVTGVHGNGGGAGGGGGGQGEECTFCCVVDDGYGNGGGGGGAGGCAGTFGSGGTGGGGSFGVFLFNSNGFQLINNSISSANGGNGGAGGTGGNGGNGGNRGLGGTVCTSEVGAGGNGGLGGDGGRGGHGGGAAGGISYAVYRGGTSGSVSTSGNSLAHGSGGLGGSSSGNAGSAGASGNVF
jgi:hypothetical protein